MQIAVYQFSLCYAYLDGAGTVYVYVIRMYVRMYVRTAYVFSCLMKPCIRTSQMVNAPSHLLYIDRGVTGAGDLGC